ncbi:MAG: RHS repeat-associated core domain-containing protein [Acidobacteriota bacterium]
MRGRCAPADPGLCYPDDALDIAYTYDDPLVPFSLGRLTQIARAGSAVDYRYDRFGRVTQDGALTFALDDNGNRIQITYPGGLVATHGYDYADRPSTVSVTPSGGAAQAIVSSSQYRAGGMPRQVVLSNGLTETRSYDNRDHPAGIQVGTLLDWTYTTDGVGNPTSILDNLNAANHRTYGYQDIQYYLEQGDGPWGQLGWTYDKLGNRLTETRDGAAADAYAYLPNVAGGNSSILDQISLGAGGTVTFGYDGAGNQTSVDTAGDAVTRTYDDASRLSSQSRPSATATSTFRYDGRSYLDRAAGRSPDSSPSAIFCDGFESGTTAAWVGAGGGCFEQPVTVPTYSSEGSLHSLYKDGSERRHILYFGGRPVAIVTESGGTSSILWLSVDHLGTPVLATDGSGVEVWSGGFEPFGADYAGAQTVGMFLRFPGQWASFTWQQASQAAPLRYNLKRWYALQTGRYTRTDPLGIRGDPHPYSYALGNTKSFIDPTGERSRICCVDIPRLPAVHCFVQIEREGKSITCGLHGGRFSAGEESHVGRIRQDKPFDDIDDPTATCGEWNEDCRSDECAIETASNYPNPSQYNAVSGSNSNTFAGEVARACGLQKPKDGWARGWNASRARPKKGRKPISSPCKLP